MAMIRSKRNAKNDKVTIAIIDSGLSSELPLNTKIVYSCSLLEGKDSEDGHGHGTALVGMMDEFCGKDIELIIFKVLDCCCKCSSYDLLIALDMAIKMSPDIINLSLGTTNRIMKDEFEEKCNLAEQKDIIIVTTTDEIQQTIPYIINNTVGVIANANILDKDKIYTDNNFKFYALGVPHIVPWKNGDKVFINKNSFTTPYFIKQFVKYKKTYHTLNNFQVLFKMRNNTLHINSCDNSETDIPIQIPNNIIIFDKLKKIMTDKIENFDENMNNFAQGFTMKGCIELLNQLEKELKCKIPYTHFNINDFYYISNLSNKINKYLSLK